jgi:disulfide bond formation protein DsbB
MTDAVTLVLSVLAILVQVALGLLLLVALAALVSAPARRVLLGARRTLSGGELPLAALIAVVATGGSLYFSEVAGFLPCPLCWWQRIFMYPLVILVGVLALDRGLRPEARRRMTAYVAPLPLLGALTAVYHVYIENVPGAQSPFCTAGVPCTIRWFEEFGYVTLPVLALTAFAAVTALLALAFFRPPADDAL